MALIVENGTGVANADSYQTLSQIEQYALSRGLAWSPSSDDAGEAAARRAATWLDSAYRVYLPGTRLKGRAQGLEWPRENALDRYGGEIPEDSVPREWKMAHSEAAVRELASPNSLLPDYTTGRVLKSATVVGAVSVEYETSSATGQSEARYPTVDAILSGLFDLDAASVSGTYYLQRA